jgi:hypothetical protein
MSSAFMQQAPFFTLSLTQLELLSHSGAATFLDQPG